ncbi:expressed unknown protein [Seminavis robusta]|uniref:Uncharacterized protein n=1 Tax=Seminavis robusta TaxID=568900 RepID=A0A9N8D6F4_9STRA|nr:expressed unknown protein [Seminavis robusta]|eukprot:Sro18_g012780.1 n/a (119) ;mRNA; r:65108-65542
MCGSCRKYDDLVLAVRASLEEQSNDDGPSAEPSDGRVFLMQLSFGGQRELRCRYRGMDETESFSARLHSTRTRQHASTRMWPLLQRQTPNIERQRSFRELLEEMMGTRLHSTRTRQHM